MVITSIKNRLLVVFLPAFIAAFLVLGGISYYFSQQMLGQSTHETAMAIGNDYANRIQSELSGIVLQLEGIAGGDRALRSGDRQAIMAALKEDKQLADELDVLTFAFIDGSAVRSDGTTANLSDREFFKQAVATKKSTISDFLVSRSTGKPSINIAVPVMVNGQLTGVLSGTLGLDRVNTLIKSVKFGESGYGFLVEDSGLILAHPTLEKAIGKLSLSEKKISADLGLTDAELDSRLLALFKQANDSGQQTRGLYALGGSDRVSVFTPIKLAGGHQWVMAVTVPAAEAVAPVKKLTFSLLSAALIMLALAVIYIMVMSQRIAAPITLIRNETVLLAEGDLRHREARVNSHDEVGQLAAGIRDMRGSLRNVLEQVLMKAEMVAASSEQLSASAQQSADAVNQVAGSVMTIAQGTEKEVEALSYITIVADAMLDKANNIASSVEAVAEIARNTATEAEQGRKAVSQTIDQMSMIGSGSEAAQAAIDELASGSREIGEIVTLISTIAGQTNLLALNAAIEAARAGEHGRGFAVVAEEVRKLAEESNRAAQRIGGLIQRNQTNMEQAVAATQAGAAAIDAGITMVTASGEGFGKIVDAIESLSGQIQEIADAITQMAVGSQELVTGVHEIEEVGSTNAGEVQNVSAATQEQSASMQEIASASHGLAEMASELQNIVQKFRV